MKTNWIEIWFADKVSMMDTMRRNLVADIEAGYNANGHSVRKQVVDIEEYEIKFNRDADRIKEMDPNKANHWCYIDLKKRGAIS
jgi:hypothetical protein